MREPRRRGWALLVVVTLAGALSCGPTVTAPPATPSSPVVVPAGDSAPPPTLSPQAVEEATQFRKRYGLRSDEAWIEDVSREPSARVGVDEFGVPLMPFELAALHARRTDRDVLGQIRDYGSLHSGDYAGAYADERVSMGFVLMFKDNVEQHRTTLTNLLPTEIQLDVRDVEWSLVDLARFQKRVEADRTWTGALGVRYQTAGHRITEDFVYVLYLGPQEAGPWIKARYGNPTWLSVERSGPLPWAGPRGDLVIDVVDGQGAPVANLWCEFKPEDPAAEEGGEMVFGTDERGRCVLRGLPAVAYRITLHRWVDNDHYEPIKELRVALRSPQTVVHVTIDPDQAASPSP